MAPAPLPSRMGDRSEERTREPRSTEDLLEETEDLLEGTGVGASEDESSGVGDVGTGTEPEEPSLDDSGTDGSWWRSNDADRTDESASSSAGGLGSRLSPSTGGTLSRLAPTGYFSPKAFLALVIALGGGMIGGEAVLPAFGRLAGMFAVAFVVGAVTSKRRYLEVATAGVLVGVIASMLNYAVFALAGFGQEIAALSAVTGVLAGLIGYYFGRDLRDGLVRDL